MAKRNANDRNERALQERKKSKASDTYTTTDGTNRVIKLKENPDLLYFQRVLYDIEVPEHPTYEVKIGSKSQFYKIDKDVIQQTEDLTERAELVRKWRKYLEDVSNYNMEVAKRSTSAMYFEGTEPDEAMIDNDAKWQKRIRMGGWRVPEDLDERWILYLQTSLKDEDATGLSNAILRRAGGVSEELIEAAEGMFFDDLPTDEGLGDLAELEADQGGDTGR